MNASSVLPKKKTADKQMGIPLLADGEEHSSFQAGNPVCGCFFASWPVRNPFRAAAAPFFMCMSRLFRQPCPSPIGLTDARGAMHCVMPVSTSHSWGSMVAGQLAGDHPALVERVVLFAPIARRDPQQRRNTHVRSGVRSA